MFVANTFFVRPSIVPAIAVAIVMIIVALVSPVIAVLVMELRLGDEDGRLYDHTIGSRNAADREQ